MRYFSFRSLIASCLIALLVSSLVVARMQEEEVRDSYDLGASGLGQLLRRLQTTASVMHTGAHPDDEDSALLARLARGDQARVAYLSLNRGEGGQNAIGTELFEPLGVIRTEELLQARHLDRAEQMFTRAFDFGFTKTRAEASQKWDEHAILGDMVRAIRTFRPLVIVSRFTGTPADGHGQHQLAGYLTPIAFHAAADPAQFPEQIKEGLHAWQAYKLYVSESFRENANNRPTLKVETGRYDQLIGRTYFEIAMQGRSQHKSQEMGTLELHGPHSSGMRLLESVVRISSTESSIFDGIDTSIEGIAKIAGLRSDVISNELRVMKQTAALSLAQYDAISPEKIIPPLAEGLRAARSARAHLKTLKDESEARAAADFLLAQKEREFTEALQRAAGVTVDALADAETIVPGESWSIAVRVFAPNASLAQVQEMSLHAPDGWRIEQITEQTPLPNNSFSRLMREMATKTASFRVTCPANAVPTEPYWLTEPRDGYLFKWPATAPKNEPFDPPLIISEVKMEIGGATIVVKRAVQYRYANPVRGELRRDLNIVPALSVAPDSTLLIVPSAQENQTRRIAVQLINLAQEEAGSRGMIRLRLPEGWHSEPVDAQFNLKKKDERTVVFFNVLIPQDARVGAYRIAAEARSLAGQTFNRELHIIAYPHIQTHRFYSPAETTVRVLDLKVVPVNVGYIMGSGDEVPAAIRRMNLPVTMLDENYLSTGDLARFDVIVVGVRASEVRPDFVANNHRLLDYVRGGGTLIVQYQRTDYVEKKLAPFPARIGPRVTDENAPVTILQPAHAAFNYPNKITSDDWKDWVQERTLYNLTDFDAHYVPLLESHDPHEALQTGSEVYAQIGRGRYIYTSYAWFRQLPAGVPGAYRLFANLLSLAKAPSANQ